MALSGHVTTWKLKLLQVLSNFKSTALQQSRQLCVLNSYQPLNIHIYAFRTNSSWGWERPENFLMAKPVDRPVDLLVVLIYFSPVSLLTLLILLRILQCLLQPSGSDIPDFLHFSSGSARLIRWFCLVKVTLRCAFNNSLLHSLWHLHWLSGKSIF